ATPGNFLDDLRQGYRTCMRIGSEVAMKHPSWALALLVLVSTVSVYGQPAPAASAPVTSPMLQNPDPADWLMWRRTLNSWGYSPLNQINRANAAQLRMVWTRGMGPGVQEATPLVHDGILFLPNPSALVQAITAATGDLTWQY